MQIDSGRRLVVTNPARLAVFYHHSRVTVVFLRMCSVAFFFNTNKEHRRNKTTGIYVISSVVDAMD